MEDDDAALRVARLYAGYHIGDPYWADQIASILKDPSRAERNLRAELGDRYESQLALRSRQCL